MEKNRNPAHRSLIEVRASGQLGTRRFGGDGEIGIGDSPWRRRIEGGGDRDGGIGVGEGERNARRDGDDDGSKEPEGVWGRGGHVLLCRRVHGPGGRGESGWPMLSLLG